MNHIKANHCEIWNFKTRKTGLLGKGLEWKGLQISSEDNSNECQEIKHLPSREDILYQTEVCMGWNH